MYPIGAQRGELFGNVSNRLAVSDGMQGPKSIRTHLLSLDLLFWRQLIKLMSHCGLQMMMLVSWTFLLTT